MRFTRPRTKTPADDALIPLINVVFLMLIFFMITGQISPPDALNIDPPSSRQGQLSDPERVLLLMDASGRVALDGEIVPAAELGERLAARLAAAAPVPVQEPVQSQCQEEQEQEQEPEPPVGIRLKADAAVTQAQLRVLLDRLRALGVERVQLLSRQVAL